MEYDWTEIFKSKTTRELYNIYLGKSALGSEQRDFARIELENRNFNFDNLDKQRRKWELESLLEEDKSCDSLFFRSNRSGEYLTMGLVSLFVFIITLIFLLRHYLLGKYIEDLPTLFFAMISGAIFTTIGFLNYKKKRGREEFRKKRIRELIDEF